jgi:sulfur carrier protein
MRLQVNGETVQLSTGSSVQHLLEQLERSTGRLAVELNGEIVPRSQFSAQLLQDGDTVEIVQAIGGG